uniref:Uncharacterized protein n=1 Tax=Hyaloperonospora arabidopsidis (strain Emoy2) TaxID=559515 RepID=M4C3K2_HYAAE
MALKRVSTCALKKAKRARFRVVCQNVRKLRICKSSHETWMSQPVLVRLLAFKSDLLYELLPDGRDRTGILVFACAASARWFSSSG